MLCWSGADLRKIAIRSPNIPSIRCDIPRFVCGSFCRKARSTSTIWLATLGRASIRLNDSTPAISRKAQKWQEICIALEGQAKMGVAVKGEQTVELFCGEKAFSQIVQTLGYDTFMLDIDPCFHAKKLPQSAAMTRILNSFGSN